MLCRQRCYRFLVLIAAALAFASDRTAYGVDPNELQSAYWRFEEGVADGFVPANPPANPQTTIADTVQDSINDNNMEAFNTDTAPKYINYNLPPTNLKSGLPNTLAWEVDGSSAGGRDVYTINEKIQNGIVGDKFDHDQNDGTPTVPSSVTGFTLEAAFNVFDYSSFRSIVAKEGRPGLEQNEGDANFQALPTMALKVRGAQSVGDPDQGKLQIELFDGAGDLKSVMTNDALLTGQWYYAAVVNDGQDVSLYLNRNDGAGYALEGSVPVDGAIFQGLNREDADWNYNWTIGRATYGGDIDGGVPSDWFNGLIDEVRLTNQVLDPSEFLFAQTGLDGDFNGDEMVDGADFLEWQQGESPSPLSSGDLTDWRDNYGDTAAAAVAAAVPEPATASLLGFAIGACVLLRRRSG